MMHSQDSTWMSGFSLGHTLFWLLLLALLVLGVVALLKYISGGK